MKEGVTSDVPQAGPSGFHKAMLVSTYEGNNVSISVESIPTDLPFLVTHVAPSGASDIVSQDAAEFSYGVPDEDEVSVAESGGGHLPSNAEDLAGFPPSGVASSMVAMLALAVVGIGLDLNPLPCPEFSQLDDWYIGSEHDSQPCPTPAT